MVTYTHYNGELSHRHAAVIERARQEASGHRPPTNATHPDQHEAALQAEADQWLSSEHRLFSAAITDGSKSAGDLQQKALELEGRIEQVLADDSLASAVAADMADERQALVQATETRMRAQVDWRHFRAHNGIREQADYPESKIWHIAIVAVFALIETSVNAFFYVNAQGLLGGFFVALAVSAVNIVGAMGLGIFFRYRNMQDRDKRIGGWLCLVAFVILSIYCNALFAAFRSEYQLLSNTNDQHQLREAFTRATNEAAKVFWLGMHFGDLMSFILFGIGLLLSVLAFYKGYTIDDRFPGHGKKDRVVKAAREIELQKQEAIRQRVKEFLNARRHELQALIHEPAQLVSNAGSRIADVERAQTTYATQRSGIQRDFTFLLTSYRDANAAIRATPPPNYFADLPNLRITLDEVALRDVLDRLRGVQTAGRELRNKYQDALNAKLNALQHDSARILNETFAEFIGGVESDAETAINRQTVTIGAAV
jgi:hypothetical protein